MIPPANAPRWSRNEVGARAPKISFAAFCRGRGRASRLFVTVIPLACLVSYGAASAEEPRFLLPGTYNSSRPAPTISNQAARGRPVGSPGVKIDVSSTLSPQAGTNHDLAVDARPRERWQLSKAMIPAGSGISFGKALLQQEHPLLILSAVAAVSLQAAIIIAMLIQDRRRRQAERSLKESEERMAFAAASTSTGFWQIETPEWSLWTSDHSRTLFGFPAEAKLTLELLIDRVHPEDRAGVAQTIRTGVRLGRPVEFEFRVLRPDGKIHWIAARGQPRDGDASRSASFIGVFTDITALKSAERDAELQRRQVTHLMRQSMLGELSGAIAHELNQPLTAILFNAETAQDLLNRKDLDLDQVRDILKDIIEDDNRAGEVIRRLRRLLRKGETKAELINLNQLVESTLNLLHGELVRRRINLEVALAADMPASVGDSVQLQQVLLNLIMNAADALGARPPMQRKLIVTTRATDEQIEAIIIDRGYGITPEIEKQLFQPFFTTKEFGLGLGLSICSTIVKSHGGKLTVQNNTYGGATATFALPIQIAMAPS
jgi:PAS domain S-box-containing protein